MSLLINNTSPEDNSPKEKYAYVTDFKDGKARAILGTDYDNHSEMLVVIDENYNVIETTFIYCSLVQKCVLWIKDYTDVYSFDETGDVHAYFVDKNLEKVSAPDEYKSILWYPKGYYIVRDSERWGILDVDLKSILEMKPSEIKIMSNGVCVRSTEDGKGTELYNPRNKKTYVVPGTIDDKHLLAFAGRFYYVFKIDEKSGMYNDEFQEVIPARYDVFGYIAKDGEVRYRKEGRYGSLNLRNFEKKLKK